MFIKEPLYGRKEKNMKKTLKTIVGIVAALTMFFAVSAGAVEIKTYSEDLSVYYNGTDVYANSQYKPIIVNDRTMVQIKPIFELMGFSSEYDNSLKKATFSKEGEEFKYSFTAEDYNVYKLSGISEHQTIPTTMDVPAMIYNDTFYVPLRAFCETLDMDIDWISAERKVLITNNKQSEANALSFTNFIGEWEDISNLYLAQSMDIGVKIISVDEENKTITLAYRYDMGGSAIWTGGNVDYREPITISYHEETVNVQIGDDALQTEETTGLKTDFISIKGSSKDVSSMISDTEKELCRFTLIVPGNGNLYYAYGDSFSCFENQRCTKVK